MFLFLPDGKIRGCYINAPGVLHDSTLANWGSLYEDVEHIYHHTGSRVVVDSAFAKANNPSMVKSNCMNMTTEGEFFQPSSVNHQATSVRQFSEWGMRGLQGSFSWLKERLHYECAGERKIIVMMMVLLYNVCATRVGQNQIRTVYFPSLDVDVDDYLNAFLHNM